MAEDTIVVNIKDRERLVLKPESSGKPYPDLRREDFDSQPFGDEYGGDFVLKRPDLGDGLRIEAIQLKALKLAGFDRIVDASPVSQDQEYAFAAVEVLSNGNAAPAWFNKKNLSTYLDQQAVVTVGRAIQEQIAIKKKNSTST